MKLDSFTCRSVSSFINCISSSNRLFSFLISITFCSVFSLDCISSSFTCGIIVMIDPLANEIQSIHLQLYSPFLFISFGFSLVSTFVFLHVAFLVQQSDFLFLDGSTFSSFCSAMPLPKDNSPARNFPLMLSSHSCLLAKLNIKVNIIVNNIAIE